MALEKWRPRWGIRPWRPFRGLEETERFFEDFLGRPFLPSLWRRFPFEEREWAPAIEMFEQEDKFVVKAELPGMKQEDIDVSVSDNTLTIKGERKSESEVKEENYYCCERSYGSFFRSINLPSNVDAENISASLDEGVLEISIPKAAEVKPKKISVSAKKKASEGKKTAK